MQIHETERCYGFEVVVDHDGDLQLKYESYEITCTPAQAAQLLPILTHYVQTGELPE